MNMDLRITVKNEYIVVVVTGAYERNEAVNRIDQILNACVEHKKTRLLVDVRSVEGKMSVEETFFYAEEFSKKYINLVSEGKLSHVKVAYVGNYPLLDKGSLGETVAVNRGIDGKVTDNIDEAISWLDVKPERKE
ncbi:MAG: hypothetical protein PHR77_06905 [Kiritimatiellae bacterium]|nr:hypothetical protein [Kiritimatiellia bacterium]